MRKLAAANDAYCEGPAQVAIPAAKRPRCIEGLALCLASAPGRDPVAAASSPRRALGRGNVSSVVDDRVPLAGQPFTEITHPDMQVELSAEAAIRGKGFDTTFCAITGKLVLADGLEHAYPPYSGRVLIGTACQDICRSQGREYFLSIRQTNGHDYRPLLWRHGLPGNPKNRALGCASQHRTPAKAFEAIM